MDTRFYRSFLVRLWREQGAADCAWRGEIEAIQSGQLVAVQWLDEALEFIRQAAGCSQPPAEPTCASE